MEALKNVSDFFDMPYDTTMNIPKIVILGTLLASVENYSALLEYKKDNIKLKYKGGVIEFSGENFEIRAIGEGTIEIAGKIKGIKLI